MLKPIGSNKHRSYFRKSEMSYYFKCIKFFLNSSYFDKARTQETLGGPGLPLTRGRTKRSCSKIKKLTPVE